MSWRCGFRIESAWPPALSVGTDTDVGIHVDVEVGLGNNDGLDMRQSASFKLPLANIITLAPTSACWLGKW